MFALKVIRFTNEEEKKEFLNEIELLKTIDHYNFTKYVDSFITNGNNICIILEYIRGTNLRNIMTYQVNIKEGTFSE